MNEYGFGLENASSHSGGRRSQVKTKLAMECRRILIRVLKVHTLDPFFQLICICVDCLASVHTDMIQISMRGNFVRGESDPATMDSEHTSLVDGGGPYHRKRGLDTLE